MRTTKPEFRVATAADVRAFYGGPLPYSTSVCVALLDGAPVAIGGVAYHSGVLCVFMDLKDEIRPYKVSIGKFVKYIQRYLNGMFGDGVSGAAIAQRDEATAPRLLEWLGFKHIATCDDGEVYQWRQQL